LIYDERDGEPHKFEGAGEVRDVLSARGGTVLVIVPLEYASQLFNFQPIQTELIGDNGHVALVGARLR
jgi:hypothetical protein